MRSRRTGWQPQPQPQPQPSPFQWRGVAPDSPATRSNLAWPKRVKLWRQGAAQGNQAALRNGGHGLAHCLTAIQIVDIFYSGFNQIKKPIASH